MNLIEKIEELPRIEFNFDELKTQLSKQLESYKNIVVAEEVLGDCKKSQKDLASFRTQIDTYRKEKKKKLSEPITRFENQCKELIALVEEVEKPLKEGIAEFDNRKREEKKRIAESLIVEVLSEYGIDETYKSEIEFNKSWTNLSASKSEVREDIEKQAKEIKEKLEKAKADRQALEKMLERENKRLKTPFSIADFEFVLNNSDLNTAIEEVYKAVERREKAENEELQEAEKESNTSEKTSSGNTHTSTELEEEHSSSTVQKAYAVLRLSGNIEDLKAVKIFMAERNISYNVIEQGVL